MKIVISSTGSDLESTVDPRFGRAAYLLIVDSKTGELVESLNNTEMVNAGQGAGIITAALVADKGVKAIMTGRVGPKAMAVVEKAKIKVLTNVSGTVRSAVAHFNELSTTGDHTPVLFGQSQEEEVTSSKRVIGQGRGRGCGNAGQGRGHCGKRQG